MRYWDLDRNRSLLHAGGSHIATAMTVVKPGWEAPVTFGKLVDLSLDLVRSYGKPTRSAAGPSRQATWKRNLPAADIGSCRRSPVVVPGDYNSVFAFCRIEGSLSSCLESGAATGRFLTWIVFDPRGTG
jgi:hypothetical protein